MSELTPFQASPEQEAVVNAWGQGLAVLAGAGSGKTTTLVAKCAKLVDRNPKARFAAVSFTERSASDLRSKLSKTLFESVGVGALTQHWIMTIHGLCGAIIREFPREAGFDGEEVVLADTDSQLLWKRSIEGLWLEDLPDEVRLSLERLLDRETRSSLSELLSRVRELFSFGVLEFLASSDDACTVSLEKISHYVLDRYERLKRRQGALDFNDLERGADRALGFPNVQESYHRRFELILVDEFQDTNPLQAKIIWKLARSQGTNLCVVGDPKQSIYRFRDADVSVFEEFCSRLPVRLSLTWNFRSLSGIIEFVNKVCFELFRASNLDFESLVPKRQQLEHQQSVVRLDVQTPEDLGKWILAEVKKGLPLGDMCLLLRKVRGNERWLKGLTASGIPIAVGSGGLFWEEARVRELVSFLKWWDNPGHTLSGAVFLRAPWIGISDLELDQWVVLDPTWRKPFFSSNHKVAVQLRPCLNQVVRPGELLMTLLVDSNMEDELGAPILGLWHRVEELSSRGLDFHAVVDELTRAVEENRRERDVPPPKNLGLLSILTLHSAKGLEFPQVILIDFGNKSRTPDAPLLFWDREKGAFLGPRDSKGDRDRKHPIESVWRELEKEKSLAESKRLFYVALTRARERLILVFPEIESLEEELSLEVVLDQDYWRAWVELGGEILPRMPLPSFSACKEFVLLKKPEFFELERKFYRREKKWTRPRHSVTEWTLLSRCPRAYEWTFIRPRLSEEEILQGDEAAQKNNLILMNVPTSQQQLGSKVHKILQEGNFEKLQELELEVGGDRFSAEPLKRWALSASCMMPPTGKDRDVWTELAFEIPYKNEVLVGSIDRIILENKGQTPPKRDETLTFPLLDDPIQENFSFQTEMCTKKYTLVDFKITEHPKSVKTLLESYQTQLELYAIALMTLDSEVRLNSIEALLVNISTRKVQTISVELGKVRVESLLEQAMQIINGEKGQPRVGNLCRTCVFRQKCAEGETYFLRYTRSLTSDAPPQDENRLWDVPS